jgi:hypothetical protein
LGNRSAQIPCGFINPNLNATSKQTNKVNEVPILKVSAFTVRLESPVSLTRDNKLLIRAPTIINMTKRMKILVIICYTPETAAFLMEASQIFEQLINES